MDIRMFNDYLDMSEDECKISLRSYELEAYSAVVTALRASGALTESKKELLLKLKNQLGISKSRYKAEIRRAVNDERLSTISFQLCGSSFDEEWQKEGRNLFGVLNRPCPITAYTKIADEIAEITAAENALINAARSGNSDNFCKKPQTVHPAKDPSKQIDPEELLPLTRKRKMTENLTEKHNIATSTDDLDNFTFPIPNNEELRKTMNCDAFHSDKNASEYVYLPGGTVVRLRSSKKEQTDDSRSQKRKKSASFQDEEEYSISDVYRPDDVKEYRKMKSSPQKLPPPEYVSPMMPHPQQQQQHQHVEPVDPQINQQVFVAQQNPENYSALPPSEPHEQPQSPDKSAVTCIRVKRKHMQQEMQDSVAMVQQTPVPPEHFEHLYTSVGATSSIKPKSGLSRSHGGQSWTAKHNVATGNKSKRKAQRSPVQQRNNPPYSRSSSSSGGKVIRLSSFPEQPLDVSRSYPGRPSPHHPNILRHSAPALPHFSAPGIPHHERLEMPSSILHQGTALPIHEAVFSSGLPDDGKLAAQRVFRPTMKIPLASQTLQKRNKLERNFKTSIETGLAPVSAIVSRVSSPSAFQESTETSNSYLPHSQQVNLGKMKVVRPAMPKPTPRLTNKQLPRVLSSVGPNPFPLDPPSYFNEYPVPKVAPHFHPIDPQRSHEVMMDQAKLLTHHTPHQVSVQQFPRSLSQSIIGKPTTSLYGEQPNKSASSSFATLSDSESLHDSVETISTESSTSQSSVNLAASGLCALASSAVVPTSATILPTSGTMQPAVVGDKTGVRISSGNIIKVTPRALPSSKVLPLGTPISAGRITKQGGGSLIKPSIIVVHRPPGTKAVAATTAKFLEISGKVPKQISHVKNVGALTRTVTVTSMSTSASVIKPVSAKLVSVPTTVRAISGKVGMASLPNVHRSVAGAPNTIHIHKGKMQQLVLKSNPAISTPPSGSAPSSSRFLHPSIPPSLDKPRTPSEDQDPQHPEDSKSLHTSPIGIKGVEADSKPASSSMQASSKIKALMAIQKSSPRTPSLDAKTSSSYSMYSQSAETLSRIKAAYPNPKLLMQKYKQRLVAISTNKHFITKKSEEGNVSRETEEK